MNEEQKAALRELLRNRAALDRYGEFANLSDGTYKIKFTDIYRKTNKNEKDFIGIKSTITEGENAKDFIIDCLHLNEEAFERSMQKIRNLYAEFLNDDIHEEDFDLDVIQSKLNALKGMEAYVTVKTNESMKSYDYKAN